jgi:hypothetical protein
VFSYGYITGPPATVSTRWFGDTWTQSGATLTFCGDGGCSSLYKLTYTSSGWRIDDGNLQFGQ